MKQSNLFNLEYASQEIKARTQKIYNQILEESANISQGNYNSIATSDLRRLFELYDELFFNNFFAENYNGEIRFRLSKRMTRAGGKTQRFFEDAFLVSISAPLVFQTFRDVDREVVVNGIVCNDRLEATMRVLEHEIIHIIEYVLFDGSSCSKPPFKRLSYNIFGHTDVTHQLVTQAERAENNFNLHVGDNVTFEYEGKTYYGFINRITKRATVMVEDAKGPFMDSRGKRYSKFYVPLHALRRADGMSNNQINNKLTRG